VAEREAGDGGRAVALLEELRIGLYWLKFVLEFRCTHCGLDINWNT